jgi:hypothetical protein
MPAAGPSHHLLVGPTDACGNHSPDVDVDLCADIARTAAHTARVWAGESTWSGLGGFDATGGFWLGPADTYAHIVFLRSPACEGWLRPASPAPHPDSLAARFPVATPPVFGDEGPRPFPIIEARLRAIPGFGGCALRHPATGLWKPVIAPPDAARLGVSTRAFTPLSRILSSQGLPAGRLLLTSARAAAIAWRTPRKIYGYLHLHDIQSLPATLGLVDSLLLCTALADQD